MPQTETHLPEAAAVRSAGLLQEQGIKHREQESLAAAAGSLSFMTTKCLPFSLSNLQCSRVSRWLVGTKMLQVTQNRSGILLTDACGICLANLLLLR